MFVRSALSLFLLTLVSGCTGEAPPKRPGELTIASASSLRPVVDSMIEVWNGEHASLPARAIYGASGMLYAQIGADAPFDLFLSADDVYPRRLHDRGLSEEPFEFATGRLAIWTPQEIDPVSTIDDLTRPRFNKIAVASPNLAPYGEAALEALEGAGLYDGLKDRLVFAGNVMEAAQFAESGSAEVAIVSLSLVTSTVLSTRGHHIIIPQELHDPIIHEGAVINGSVNAQAARDFARLLQSDDGRRLLERAGFLTPKDMVDEGGK